MTGGLVDYWLNLLPISHDVEEAQVQYNFLAELTLAQPALVFGANPAAVAT